MLKTDTVEELQQEEFEETPMYAAILTYLSYSILCLFGWLRDFMRQSHLEQKRGAVDPNDSLVRSLRQDRAAGCLEPDLSFVQGFVPLYQSYESFYTRNMYTRVRDIFNRPIASVPGSQFHLTERISDDYNWTYRYESLPRPSAHVLDNDRFFSLSPCRYTGKTISAINLGSYNYLGFAEKTGPCANDAIDAIKSHGIVSCSTRTEIGKLSYPVFYRFLVPPR